MNIEVIYIIQFLLLLAWSLLFFLTIWFKEYQIKKAKELKGLCELLAEYDYLVLELESDLRKAISFGKKGSKN